MAPAKMPAARMAKQLRRFMARLQILVGGPLPASSRGSMRAAAARASAHAGRHGLALRSQTRGGGDGGIKASDVALRIASAVSWERDGPKAKPNGVGSAAEKPPEHLSSQPGSFAQSPFACLSQCCPCGQQSAWAETSDISDE